MRGRKRRGAAGFNLAFLDIMACGLGAIILVFMLVKYQTEAPFTELHALQTDLAAAQHQTRAVAADRSAQAARLKTLQQELQQRRTRAAAETQKNNNAAAEIIKITQQLNRLQQQKAQQTQAAATPQENNSATPDSQQDHLLGLRVGGARIVILLDSSASMADERLVDIIKIKVANTDAKKNAPKWQRALNVVDWMLARVPPSSEYMIIQYNAKPSFVPTQQWRRGDDAEARAQIQRALAELYPHAATNLHAALTLIKDSISPTDIYVITDGLPTQGAKRCSIFASKTTVSGKCREQLFLAAVQSFVGNPAKVNVVLLPIEGDPKAAYAYWRWAAATAGVMLSPAASWP